MSSHMRKDRIGMHSYWGRGDTKSMTIWGESPRVVWPWSTKTYESPMYPLPTVVCLWATKTYQSPIQEMIYLKVEDVSSHGVRRPKWWE